MMIPPELPHELLYDITSAVHPYTVCLFTKQDGHDPSGCGTGTLYAVGEYRFLITAGHLIRDLEKASAPLFTMDSGVGNFVRIQGAAYSTPVDESREGDESGPLDLGIIELTDDDVAALESKRFVNNSMVSSKVRHDGLFCLMGYPTSRTGVLPQDKMHFVVEAIRVVTNWARQQREFCDTEVHLLLRMDKALAYGSDGENTALESRPMGLSGSGVWAIGRGAFESGSCPPEHLRLVGVETRVFKDDAIIRATSWLQVQRFIAALHPEISDAFRARYPEA